MSEGPITAVSTNGSTQNLPINMVLDKFVTLITSAEGNGGRALAIERSGVTARNGLILSDDVRNFHFQSSNDQYGPMVGIRNQAVLSGTSQFEPIEIYGLTLVDRLSSANNASSIAEIRENAAFDNVQVSGVITHAPAKDTPDMPFAPLSEGAALGAQAQWKGPAYRPGTFTHDLIFDIDATQTTGIVIGEDFDRRAAVEGWPLTFILGGTGSGEQITATGQVPNGANFELTGVTRGANGTTAASHPAGSGQVWNAPIARLTAYAATPGFARRWTPDAGSRARGGANGAALRPLDDILGNLRTGVTDVDDGAFQVSA
jgi:hypothetical protein